MRRCTTRTWSALTDLHLYLVGFCADERDHQCRLAQHRDDIGDHAQHRMCGLHEHVPIPFPAPIEFGASLPAVEESVANRDGAQDRGLVPPIAASQEDHPDAICELVELHEDYYS
ncbi:hypothetical protein Aduo_008521 [Ancylostoma duodenale]